MKFESDASETILPNEDMRKEDFISKCRKEYISSMRKKRTYGGQTEIQAVANIYNSKIEVWSISAAGKASFQSVMPENPLRNKSNSFRVLISSAGNNFSAHYSVISPDFDPLVINLKESDVISIPGNGNCMFSACYKARLIYKKCKSKDALLSKHAAKLRASVCKELEKNTNILSVFFANILDRAIKYSDEIGLDNIFDEIPHQDMLKHKIMNIYRDFCSNLSGNEYKSELTQTSNIDDSDQEVFFDAKDQSGDVTSDEDEFFDAVDYEIIPDFILNSIFIKFQSHPTLSLNQILNSEHKDGLASVKYFGGTLEIITKPKCQVIYNPAIGTDHKFTFGLKIESDKVELEDGVFLRNLTVNSLDVILGSSFIFKPKEYGSILKTRNLYLKSNVGADNIYVTHETTRININKVSIVANQLQIGASDKLRHAFITLNDEVNMQIGTVYCEVGSRMSINGRNSDLKITRSFISGRDADIYFSGINLLLEKSWMEMHGNTIFKNCKVHLSESKAHFFGNTEFVIPGQYSKIKRTKLNLQKSELLSEKVLNLPCELIVDDSSHISSPKGVNIPVQAGISGTSINVTANEFNVLGTVKLTGNLNLDVKSHVKFHRGSVVEAKTASMTTFMLDMRGSLNISSTTHANLAVFFIGPGATFYGASKVINTLVYANAFGFVSSYNFDLNSLFINLNLGAHVACLPRSFPEAMNLFKAVRLASGLMTGQATFVGNIANLGVKYYLPLTMLPGFIHATSNILFMEDEWSLRGTEESIEKLRNSYPVKALDSLKQVIMDDTNNLRNVYEMCNELQSRYCYTDLRHVAHIYMQTKNLCTPLTEVYNDITNYSGIFIEKPFDHLGWDDAFHAAKMFVPTESNYGVASVTAGFSLGWSQSSSNIINASLGPRIANDQNRYNFFDYSIGDISLTQRTVNTRYGASVLDYANHSEIRATSYYRSTFSFVNSEHVQAYDYMQCGSLYSWPKESNIFVSHDVDLLGDIKITSGAAYAGNAVVFGNYSNYFDVNWFLSSYFGKDSSFSAVEYNLNANNVHNYAATRISSGYVESKRLFENHKYATFQTDRFTLNSNELKNSGNIDCRNSNFSISEFMQNDDGVFNLYDNSTLLFDNFANNGKFILRDSVLNGTENYEANQGSYSYIKNSLANFFAMHNYASVESSNSELNIGQLFQNSGSRFRAYNESSISLVRHEADGEFKLQDSRLTCSESGRFNQDAQFYIHNSAADFTVLDNLGVVESINSVVKVGLLTQHPGSKVHVYDKSTIYLGQYHSMGELNLRHSVLQHADSVKISQGAHFYMSNSAANIAAFDNYELVEADYSYLNIGQVFQGAGSTIHAYNGTSIVLDNYRSRGELKLQDSMLNCVESIELNKCAYIYANNSKMFISSMDTYASIEFSYSYANMERLVQRFGSTINARNGSYILIDNYKSQGEFKLQKSVFNSTIRADINHDAVFHMENSNAYVNRMNNYANMVFSDSGIDISHTFVNHYGAKACITNLNLNGVNVLNKGDISVSSKLFVKLNSFANPGKIFGGNLSANSLEPLVFFLNSTDATNQGSIYGFDLFRSYTNKFDSPGNVSSEDIFIEGDRVLNFTGFLRGKVAYLEGDNTAVSNATISMEQQLKIVSVMLDILSSNVESSNIHFVAKYFNHQDNIITYYSLQEMTMSRTWFRSQYISTAPSFFSDIFSMQKLRSLLMMGLSLPIHPHAMKFRIAAATYSLAAQTKVLADEIALANQKNAIRYRERNTYEAVAASVGTLVSAATFGIVAYTSLKKFDTRAIEVSSADVLVDGLAKTKDQVVFEYSFNGFKDALSRMKDHVALEVPKIRLIPGKILDLTKNDIKDYSYHAARSTAFKSFGLDPSRSIYDNVNPIWVAAKDLPPMLRHTIPKAYESARTFNFKEAVSSSCSALSNVALNPGTEILPHINFKDVAYTIADLAAPMRTRTGLIDFGYGYSLDFNTRDLCLFKFQSGISATLLTSHLRGYSASYGGINLFNKVDHMTVGHNTFIFTYKNSGSIYSNVVLSSGLDLNSNMNIQTNYFHSNGLYGLRNSVLAATSSSYDYTALYSSSADMGNLGKNRFIYVENSFVKSSGDLTGKIYGSYSSVDHKGPVTGNGEIDVNNLDVVNGKILPFTIRLTDSYIESEARVKTHGGYLDTPNSPILNNGNLEVEGSIVLGQGIDNHNNFKSEDVTMKVYSYKSTVGSENSLTNVRIDSKVFAQQGNWDTDNLVFNTEEHYIHNLKHSYSGVLHGVSTSFHESGANVLSSNHEDATFYYKTENGVPTYEHHGKFGIYQLNGLTASEARDFALGVGIYSNMHFEEGIDVSTTNADTVEYAGLRSDGTYARLTTGGIVSLPASFDRAKGMTFATYDEAIQFIAKYDTHNLPKPIPPKKKWHQKLKKEAFKGVVGAGLFVAKVAPKVCPEGVVIGIAAGLAAAGAGIGLAKMHKKDKLWEKNVKNERASGVRFAENRVLSEMGRAAFADIVKEQHFVNLQAAFGNNDANGGLTLSIDELHNNQIARRAEIAAFLVNGRQVIDQNHNNELNLLAQEYKMLCEQIDARIPKMEIGGAMNFGSTGRDASLTFSTWHDGKKHTAHLPFYNKDFSTRRNIELSQADRGAKYEYIGNRDDIYNVMPADESAKSINFYANGHHLDYWSGLNEQENFVERRDQAPSYADNIIQDKNKFLMLYTFQPEQKLSSGGNSVARYNNKDQGLNRPATNNHRRSDSNNPKVSVVGNHWFDKAVDFWADSFRDYDDQPCSMHDRSTQLSYRNKAAGDLVDAIDEGVFKHIRRGKDAVIDGYFGKDARVREKVARQYGIKQDITSLSWAGPTLAKAAVSLVPDTIGEVIIASAANPILSKTFKYGVKYGKKYFFSDKPIKVIEDVVDNLNLRNMFGENSIIRAEQIKRAYGLKDNHLINLGELSTMPLENGHGRALLSQFMPLDHNGKTMGKGLRIYQEGSEVVSLKTYDILPSQATAKLRDIQKYTPIMKSNGWGEFAPIDVVRMPDGKLFTFDHRRFAAARDAGIDVRAIIHEYNDLLPNGFTELRHLEYKSGKLVKTWEDAINYRIQRQRPTHVQELLRQGKLELELK